MKSSQTSQFFLLLLLFLFLSFGLYYAKDEKKTILTNEAGKDTSDPNSVNLLTGNNNTIFISFCYSQLNHELKINKYTL
jgi:hypothetical protein